MKKNYLSIAAVIFVLILMNSFFIITEKEQAVKTAFGKPVGKPLVDAGLQFKLPFIQTIIKFDKRVLEWDGVANEIPTKDNKYILIDTFARWKISDALKFYKSAKNEMLAQSRLDDIIDGAVRDEIANRSMSEIVKSTDSTILTAGLLDYSTVKSLNDSIPSPWLNGIHFENTGGTSLSILNEAKRYIDIFSPNWKLIMPNNAIYLGNSVTELQNNGYTVIPWTINRTDIMLQLIEEKVDGIITDYPDSLLLLMNKMNIHLKKN